MPASINVNNLTVVHKDSNGVSFCFPDVCKTPTPGGPVPIPYPNIAMSKDTAMGSTTVAMDGNPIMLKGSVYATSTGDEPGSLGGVVSNVVKGKAEFLNYSFDVKVEGKNVPRLLDPMGQNESSPPNGMGPANMQPLLAVIPTAAAAKKKKLLSASVIKVLFQSNIDVYATNTDKKVDELIPFFVSIPPAPAGGTPSATSGTPATTSGTPAPAGGTSSPASGTPATTSGTPAPGGATPSAAGSKPRKTREAHWEPGPDNRPLPACYVRDGPGVTGSRERKLQVTLEITTELGGTAKLTAKDAEVEVEGTQTVTGSSPPTKQVVVFNCVFTKLPSTVRLLEKWRFAWTLELEGETRDLNATNLTLFIVDQNPKLVNWWTSRIHNWYEWVLEHSCRWADGKTGVDQVFGAIWDKFSTGTEARINNETKWSYWKTGDPSQALYELPYEAELRGWSCKSTCHFFMMAIAVHGLECQSVIPTSPVSGRAPGSAFLVAKWTLVGAGGDPSNSITSIGPFYTFFPHSVPVLSAGQYYAGDWDATPKLLADRAGWTRDAIRASPPHPAQGQRNPPLMFHNHWILELKTGSTGLYDTSYGGGRVEKGPSGPFAGPLGAYQAVAISGWFREYLGASLIVVGPTRWEMKNNGPDAVTT
jgi:hypothetical protein